MIIKVFNASRFSFERKTPGASGYDLSADLADGCWIHAGQRRFIGTGIHVAMPLGIEAQVRPRSGLARVHGVQCAVGTVDSDYTGEIGVTLFNHGQAPYAVMPGDRIAQLAFAPVILPDLEIMDMAWWSGEPIVIEFVSSLADLGVTERGAAGFGSTGR